ncbi:asparagine synthase-related protein [Embleya sp. NPDC020630]|uniref:asparagine synthase-related protein n=1 Tax=Embleya sp. NPDC020630 TaxID=3363979 RepID=UPI0037BCDE4E
MAVTGTDGAGEWVGAPPGREVAGLSRVWVDDADTRVRVASRPGSAVRLAVWGDCGASEAELDAGLEHVAAGDWTALTRWSGSYWVSADDGDGRRVLIGDLSGFRGLHHARAAGGAHLWSTSALPLAGAVRASPDLAVMTARLVCGDLWPQRSAWSGVECVAGGRALVFDGDGSCRQVDVSGLGALSYEDGARTLGEALRTEVERVAVAAGVLGNSCDLSGGLDSSTVTILAARVAPLLTVHWAGSRASAEDRAFADRVAGHIRTLSTGHAYAHVVTESGGHFDRPDAPVRLDASVGPLIAQGTEAAYLVPAIGRPWHLTGHGGDIVLDADPAAVWVDLVRAGRRREAKRLVVDAARLRASAPGPSWARVKAAAARDRGEALRAAARVLRVGGDANVAWPWLGLNRAVDLLSATGREAVAHLLEEAASADGPRDAARWSDWSALHAAGAVARHQEPLHRHCGVRPAHPFLANSVVRAAFAIPPTERHRNGRYKALLGAALGDVLPPWLCGRRSKGSFSQAMITDIRTHRAELEALVDANPLIGAGLVRADAARALLADTAAGRPTGALRAVITLVADAMWAESVTGASC